MKLTHLTSSVVVVFALSLPCHGQAADPQERPKAGAESKFQTAQRYIFTATNLLEAVIRENPRDKDAAIARLQLKRLKDISSTSTVVVPVRIGFVSNSNYYTEWHVASVDARPEATIVTLKIENTQEKDEAKIYAFDTHPLVMLDNKGEYYPMQEAPAVPAGVKVEKPREKMKLWVLQPQRVLTLPVVFAPLAPGATGGKILFKDDNEATPAEFSLLNKKQMVEKPTQKHELRTWTTSDGKSTVEARFVRYGSRIVTLQRMDGETIDVPIEKLSKEDQDYTMQTHREIGDLRRAVE